MTGLQVFMAAGAFIGAVTTSLAATFSALAQATGEPGWYVATGVTVAIGAGTTAALAVLKPPAAS